MLSEKVAIEKLKKIRQDTINANECGLSNNDFKEEIEVYDVVLNIIDRLRKENEDIQNRKEHQELRFKKYKEDMEKQHEEIYEDLVFEKEEKDKIINLMAETFKQDDARSVEEIIEYFENKVKGENK